MAAAGRSDGDGCDLLLGYLNPDYLAGDASAATCRPCRRAMKSMIATRLALVSIICRMPAAAVTSMPSGSAIIDFIAACHGRHVAADASARQR